MIQKSMSLKDSAEPARHHTAWSAPEPEFGHGYGWIFARHVSQADSGCDFDFLERNFGPTPGEPVIY